MANQFSTNKKEFAHLHLHTDYSLLESAIQLKPLAKKLTELEMKSCAITDYGNMYGAVSFYNTLKANDLKPILGYEAYLTFGSRFEKGAPVKSGELPYYHLVLLAQNLKGYYNLAHLASKAFTEGFHYKPRVDIELLSEFSEGLIALSGSFRGAIWHYLKQDNMTAAREKAALFADIFGKENFYLEIQDHGLETERKIRRSLVEFSARNAVPLVATNDAHYLTREDHAAHELLYCISEQKTVNDGSRTTLGSDQYYVRSPEEMWELFGGELPRSLLNTLEISERCDIKLPGGADLQLPQFPIPADSGCQTTDEYFEKIVLDGFEERKKTVWDIWEARGNLKYPLAQYEERVRTEISIIRNMGFPGYFLIVWEFIRYAREKQIPVGPGRGSAAGSLVAYCLNITDVDPLQYDLLFERFLNPERVSMPDIDIDFCVRGRAEVINHVTEIYGRDSVCLIITFGTMASKAAIKDVGRALDMPYGDVEKIAKMIPPPVRGRNVSISQALEQVADLKQAMEADRQVKKLVDLALRLEGCARHSSVHAAGVVISPQPLHTLLPVAVSGKSELTSQYSMSDLEKVGMLKMDFLALTTLTILNDCLIALKSKADVEIDWGAVDLDDEKTMKLFGDGKTEAIFQFESTGMQEICRRLKPKVLEDLAALNALYRPGPLDGGMVDDFISRHRGEKQVRYIVPEMKEILSNTYGILVYQEQIMQLAQKLAGYTLGDADLMRRAMGKKKREEMALHQEKFVTGAVERNIKKEKAEEIFNLMAQFADYGFNRSHSVAYAYLAFQTAYLKAHYPAYFYASVLSHEADDAAKIYKYSHELKHSGIRLLPPDVNESDADFTPSENSVRFGLNAIKGIGAASVSSIINARQQGKFNSLFDFTSRIESGGVNKRALESLICAGAFDSLIPQDISLTVGRACLQSSIDSALSQSQKKWNDKLRGQSDLFFETDSGADLSADIFKMQITAWSKIELSKAEKAAVGFYLSNHPLDDYAAILETLKIRKIAEHQEIVPGERLTIAGIVAGLQIRHSKKGNKFCIFKLEDQSAGVKCLGWSEAFTKYIELIKDDELLLISGRVESNEGQELTVIFEEAQKLEDVVPSRARKLFVQADGDELESQSFENLLSCLSSGANGKCEVYLDLKLADRISTTILATPLRIGGSRRLEQELSKMGCRVRWEVI